MIKKILLTGGAGFIGLNLCNALIKKKFKVIILDNFTRKNKDSYFKKMIKNKSIKFINLDIKKKIKLKNENPDLIFHLAGSLGVQNISSKPFLTAKNNILSNISLVEFALSLKKKPKVILFSTSEVYSPLIKKKIYKSPFSAENDLLIKKDVIPRDSYYLSKILNEKILQLSGLNYIILRPHNIYGPRMGYRHVIPELFSRISKSQKKIKIYSPNHTRAFCYIDDAIKQIIKVSFNKRYTNQTYNIGNMKEEIKIFDLAKKIQSYVKNDCRIFKGPNTSGSPKKRRPDMRKTLKLFKNFNFTDLNKGLQKTLDWYKNNEK